MSQTPPDNKDFLSNVLENVKDMPPPLRIIIVFFLVLVFIWVNNVVVPDDFVPLIYLLITLGVVAYLVWEIQQLKARRDERRDVQDHEFRMKQLEFQHEEEERKREHERKLKETEQSQPPTPNPALDPAELHTDYLNWLLGQVSELPGIDPKAAGDEQDGRLHLNHIYTALLTYELESPNRTARFGEREQKPVSAVAQLDRHNRLVLLGDPGSGKSTFVNFIALCLANERLDQTDAGLSLLTAPLPDEKGEDTDQGQPWAHGPLLPLRIILRDFAATGLPAPGQPASDKQVWDFVGQLLATATLSACLPALQAQFKSGQAILLLDGLDEVDEANHRCEQIKQVVEAFARKYPQSRILVTSRTYAYQQQQWQLAGFKDAQLTPFTPGQIIRFVDGWYRYTALRRGMEAGLAQKRADQLKEAIFSQPRLHELAERPLLLTLMASLHAWRMGELPRQRQKLYEETVDLLLDRWENRQKVWNGREEQMQPSLAEWLKTDRDKVRELLNRLAYEAHAAADAAQSGTADIPQDKLLNGLLNLNQNRDAQPYQLEAYLRDRAGLLAARGEGVYTFPHRTFQEYLAACYLVDQDPEYPFHLARLCRDEPNKWREVLLLGGAKKGRNDVWFLADALCPDDPSSAVAASQPDRDVLPTAPPDLWGAHLAGQMLLEIIALDDPLNAHNKKRLERLQDWLVHCLTTPHLPPIERALAGRTLGLFGDPRPDVACAVPEMVDIPAGPFLMGSDKAKDKLAWDDEEPQHTVTLPVYRIGKYPVTNGQWQRFMDAGGYESQVYWTKAGWQQRQQEGWTEPRYWQDSDYNIANQPVVGVSWYEAVAYCNWLKGETGRPFRLPSEAMWEKGARGTDGRIYPWGNDWNPNNLNAAETNINRPSAVGIFPDGQSPYGVYDACGNVLEWCSTVWGENYPLRARPYAAELKDTGRRIWRGGAFRNDSQHTRAAYRHNHYPDHWNFHIGFRVAEHLSDSAS